MLPLLTPSANTCSLCGVSRGVYLATVFYHKENILVTSEDQLPLVEIQCCSTSIIQDFLWFVKVSPASKYVKYMKYVSKRIGKTSKAK